MKVEAQPSGGRLKHVRAPSFDDLVAAINRAASERGPEPVELSELHSVAHKHPASQVPASPPVKQLIVEDGETAGRNGSAMPSQAQRPGKIAMLKKISDYVRALRHLGRTSNESAITHNLSQKHASSLERISAQLASLQQRASRDLAEGRLTRIEERLSKLDRSVLALQPQISSGLHIINERQLGSIRSLEQRVQAHEQRVADVESTLLAMGSSGGVRALQEKQSSLAREVELQRRAYTELSRTLQLILREVRSRLPEPLAEDQLQTIAGTDDPLVSAFYSRFEDLYRGSRDEIRSRLRIYLPELRNIPHSGPTLKVLDLGCGRGEWLELVRDEGWTGLGVDTSAAQLEDARAFSVDVIQTDALEFLRGQPAGSWNVVSSMHVVEHLPFSILSDFMREILRVLAPNGLMILETPNPQNIIVGAFSFHLDPTHRKPLPPQLTRTMAETIGFVDVRLLPLHPDPRLEGAIAKGIDEEIAQLLFGARDYALLSSKAE